jgi:hypothetical protein
MVALIGCRRGSVRLILMSITEGGLIMSAKTLARAILKAADYHENSWNGDRYDLGFYTSAVQACAILRADSGYVEIINMLLHFAWDDAIFWAEKMED